jgi:3',5'-cyclic-AMP phosphodiesterase
MAPDTFPEPAERLVVVQLSDLHITAEGNLNGLVDTLETVRIILDSLEETPPDALLLTGDVADRGEPGAYQRLRPLLEGFAQRTGVPVIAMPGNHDERRAFREHLLGWEGTDQSVDQVHHVKGLRIVSLDTSVGGAAHGELDDAQLGFLSTQLEQPAPLGTIIALHHPPIPGPSSFLNTILLREPERLGRVVQGRDVKMILAGHAHHASAGSIAGVPVWVATATAYQLDVHSATTTSLKGIEGSAFTRIDIDEQDAVATHIPLSPGAGTLYEYDLETTRQHIAALERGEGHAELEHAAPAS